MHQPHSTSLYAKTSPILRLTERDKHILETIHAYDGMMSLKQIDRLFFSGQGRTQPRARMRALCANGYINTPSKSDQHKVPFGETIYWLNTSGAAAVAALQGMTLSEFVWSKNPRWSLVTHNLAVNDFRMDVVQAVHTSPTLTLCEWIPEVEFWAHPDKVKYTEKDTEAATHTRYVRPDGFFLICRQSPHQPSRVEEFAFLLEIDMRTEDNPRFAREKVRPGIAYLKSQAYQERFGLRYGRWLVVTTGERRLHNLKTQTERAGGNGLFYFTTFAKVSASTVLTAPIWHLAGSETPTGIIPSHQDSAT